MNTVAQPVHPNYPASRRQSRGSLFLLIFVLAGLATHPCRAASSPSSLIEDPAVDKADPAQFQAQFEALHFELKRACATNGIPQGDRNGYNGGEILNERKALDLAITQGNQPEIARFAVMGLSEKSRAAALKSVTNQTALGLVAIYAKDWKICRDAFDRLTAENVLAQVAFEADSWTLRRDALAKLAAPEWLSKAAMQDPDWQVRMTAVSRLQNRKALEQIIPVEKHVWVRLAAVARLHGLFGPAASMPSNYTADLYAGSAILKLLPELCDGGSAIPAEHTPRLSEAVVPVFRILGDPDVARELGQIQWGSVGWYPTSQQYFPGGKMPGERFTIWIKLDSQYQFRKYWETEFPQKTRSFRFLPAEVTISSILEPILEPLSPKILTKIALNDPSPAVQLIAVNTLTNLSALNQLIVDTRDPGLRKAVTNRLDWLQRELRNPTANDPAAWERAAPQEVKKEIEVLRTGSVDEKVKAAERLADMRTKAKGASLALEEMLTHKDWKARRAAIRAMGATGNKRTIEVLLKATVTDEKPSNRLEAEHALSALDYNWGKSFAARETLPLLVEALAAKDRDIRTSAVNTLRQIDDPRAIKALIQALSQYQQSSSPLDISAARGALANAGARAVDPLIQALKGADLALRKHAAELLGWIGDKRAVEPLTEALKDRTSGVSEAAANALKKIEAKP